LTTVKLLIFDCDGVLIDSEPASSRSLAKALRQAGVSIDVAEVHRRFTGASAAESRRICIDEFGLSDMERIFDRCQAEMYEEFARSLTPIPGMAQLVRSLPHLKCVASNSSMERLRRSLGLFDLWSEFYPHIFSAEMVRNAKPAPDLFLLCARSFGVDPAQCLVIDDSVHGVAGAVAAGMKAIGFVDPVDPRDDREAVLEKAGASIVVHGADELAPAIRHLAPALEYAVPEFVPG
jgi:HAD superfamily hydrolase (TIGR01509 family)